MSRFYPAQRVSPKSLNKSRLVAAVLLSIIAGQTMAADLDTFERVTQEQFRLITADLGSALSYKGLVPAETTGPLGFDVGLAVTGTQLKHSETLSQAAGGSDISGNFLVPSLRVYKGLPFGLSVGGMLAEGSSNNIRLIGGELRWAALEGNAVTPAIALRAAATKMTGVDQLDFDTRSIDVSISKGVLNLTPYAGIGRIQVNSTPHASTGLAAETIYQTRTFVGLNVNLGINLSFEADKTGDIVSYGVKAGIRF